MPSVLEQYNQAMELDPITGKPMEKTSVVGFGKATAVVKSDTTILPATKGLYIGGTGDLVVTMVDGVDITLKAVSTGAIYDLSVTKVKAATTATDIVALY